jgi:hypothetical protein
MQWVVAGVAAFVVLDVVAILLMRWGAKTAAPDPAYERRMAQRRAVAQAWTGPERRRGDRRAPSRVTSPA